MPTSGDVVLLDLGRPAGHEAAFRRPAVLVTAQRILDAGPDVVYVVPLTTRLRGFHTEVPVGNGGISGLPDPSVARCQHVRAVSAGRIDAVAGNVGPVVLARIREMLALLLDLPA